MVESVDDPVEVPLDLQSDEQEEACWHALLDLFEQSPDGWTLIGGRLVQLHCWERGSTPTRTTTDIDAGLDVRGTVSQIADFTAALKQLSFTSAGFTPDGHQHRWVRDRVVIDVLIPASVGERAGSQLTRDGARMLESHGIQQAIQRTETVRVTVGRRTGHVRRPTLFGALVAKSAALRSHGDLNKQRHLEDFLQLCALLQFTDVPKDMSKRDSLHLGNMLGNLINRGFEPNPGHQSYIGVQLLRRHLARRNELDGLDRSN